MKPLLIATFALGALGALLAGPAVAHDRHHNGYHDSHVRIYPADRSRHFRKGHRRQAHVPFRQFDGRRYNQYRYYPRHNPRQVFVRPRHFNRFGGGQVRSHFHRHQPLLQVLTGFDRYQHCPEHGGYFLRDDLYYH